MEFEEATKEELETLEFHITQWNRRTAAEHAVCLAVLRGHCFAKDISEKVGMSVPDVEQAIARLLGQGLLRDNGRLMLH